MISIPMIMIHHIYITLSFEFLLVCPYNVFPLHPFFFSLSQDGGNLEGMNPVAIEMKRFSKIKKNH